LAISQNNCGLGLPLIVLFGPTEETSCSAISVAYCRRKDPFAQAQVAATKALASNGAPSFHGYRILWWVNRVTFFAPGKMSRPIWGVVSVLSSVGSRKRAYRFIGTSTKREVRFTPTGARWTAGGSPVGRRWLTKARTRRVAVNGQRSDWRRSFLSGSGQVHPILLVATI
jgi:hypothetical protein